MVNNLRETGCPRMDRFDDGSSNIEKFLTKASCYVIPAPIAGVAKIIMGLFQTIIGIAGTIYSIAKKDGILKERWITHIQNGLGNIIRGTLESIPLVGLIIHVAFTVKHTPDLAGYPGYFTPTCDDNLSIIRYPSIGIRTWKIVDLTGYNGEATKKDTEELEGKFQIALDEESNPNSLNKRMGILNKILENYKRSEKSERCVGQGFGFTRPENDGTRRKTNNFVIYRAT